MITLELSPRINVKHITVLCDDNNIEFTAVQNIIKINVLDNKEHTIQIIESYERRSRRVVAKDGDYFYVAKQFAWWSKLSWLMAVLLLLSIIIFMQHTTWLKAVTIVMYCRLFYLNCFRLNIIKYNGQRRWG